MKTNKKRVLSLVLVIVLSLTCFLVKKDIFTNKVDEFSIVKTTIEYLFDKQEVSSFFYKKPILLLESPWIQENNRGLINGLPYKLVKAIPPAKERDWFHPLPYIEIWNIIERDKDNIDVRIFFPTTGSLFNVSLDRKGDTWQVKKFDQSKLKS